jgi:hypothetical protein
MVGVSAWAVTRRTARHAENPKSEIRNPKQIRKAGKWAKKNRAMWMTQVVFGFLFIGICFGFRASDFEFSPSQGFLQFIQPLVVSGELPALLAVGGFDAALGA